MPVTTESIYAPLSKFFLDHYASAAGSQVQFRFDKFGSVISQADFIDPMHPELGYSANLARERFSDLVNHIAVDAGDDTSLFFRSDDVDETYFYRLLSPAVPATLGADGSNTDVAAAFSTLKASALKQWTNVTLSSSLGLMLEFKPSLATPDNWYNRDAPGIWTQQQFTISSAQNAEGNSNSNGNTVEPIWRRRLTDIELQHVVLPPTLRVRPPILQEIQIAKSGQNLPGNVAAPGTAVAMNPHFAVAATLNHPAAIAAAPADTVAAAPAPFINPGAMSFALHNQLRTGLLNASIGERQQLVQVLAQAAPTQAASTDTITVSFSYALVRITRPWLFDTFLQDGSWYVPGLDKGAVSGSGAASGFSLQTTAFVVVKDLAISANWSAADVNAASVASDFGPFKVEPGLSNNTLNHPGIQVIGWLVESLPALPPNNPPL